MFDRLAELRREVLEHIDKVIILAKGQGNDNLLSSLVALKQEIENLRYNIAILGFMKRGKSTLLNVLMRRANDDISPVRTKACTSVIVRYLSLSGSGLDSEGAIVYFKDSEKQQRSIALRQVRDFVDEEKNPSNILGVHHIDVCSDFPILNDMVALLDTPGKGSIHEAHDVIADEVLPSADALILTICSDLPIEAAERVFLKELNKHERERVFVVLTKTDELRDEKEIADTEFWVQSQLKDTSLSCEEIYKTSAKPVFDALIQGKSDEEVDFLASKHGIKGLESAIESFILKHSDKNALLLHRLQTVLSYTNRYCEGELGNIELTLKCMKIDRTQLEAELSTLQERAKTLRKDRNKSIATFRRGWERELHRFSEKLLGKEARLVDRLIERFERDGLLTATFRRPLVEVSKAVAIEISPLISDLAEKLESVREQLQVELQDSIDAYSKGSRARDLVAERAATGGVMLLGTGGALGIVATIGAFTSAATAWSALATTTTTATALTGGVGVLPTLWAWLWGVSATTATATAASASTAATIATTTAIAATATLAATAVIAVGATWVTKEAVKIGLKAFHGSRLPVLLQEELERVSENVSVTLNLQRDQLVKAYEDGCEDFIRSTEERIGDILDALDSQDPDFVPLLEKKQQALIGLEKRGKEIGYGMQQLT